MSWFNAVVELIRDPGAIITWGGYPALAAIVFLETGAMVFFLPGDSLLIVAGFYAAKGDLSVLALNALLGPMAVLGDALAYQLGRRMGQGIYARPDGRLIKRGHVRAAQTFYERHGGKAIVLARFVPLVRSFVPVVAGVAGMPYRQFFAYNAAGGLGWVGSMTLVGWGLGHRFPFLLDHMEKIIVAVVALSLLPGVVEVLRERARTRRT